MIRPARAGDLAAIPDIETSAATLFDDFGEALPDGEAASPSDHWRAALAEESLWVATDADDRPVGFIACVCYGQIMYVQEVDVSRDHQDQGLGRALMETAIAAARARGLTAVALTTNRQLPFNAPFYASLGFAERADPPPWLARIVADEERRGLPDRCAMLLEL